MAQAAVLQEVTIAKAEAAKLIANPKATIEELQKLSKNIDRKRKEFAMPYRNAIKEIDVLFKGPIESLKKHTLGIQNKKQKKLL